MVVRVREVAALLGWMLSSFSWSAPLEELRIVAGCLVVEEPPVRDRETGRDGDGEGVLNVLSVIDPELLDLCRPPLPRPRAEFEGEPEACL